MRPLEAAVGHGPHEEPLVLPDDALVEETGEDELSVDPELVVGQEEGLFGGGGEVFGVGEDGEEAAEGVQGRHAEVGQVEDRHDALLDVLGEVDGVGLLTHHHGDEAVVVEARVADLLRQRP